MFRAYWFTRFGRYVGCVLLGFSVSAFASDADIAKLFDFPEDKMDIGMAALMLAKEVDPATDIPAYSRKIDELVQRAAWLAANTKDPEQRIRVLNTVIYRDSGFRYDHDPSARTLSAHYLLTGILDHKKGICYTMPLLYMAVAQRLGYPVYMVIAPDHMFLRYVDSSFKYQNIEATSGGKYLPDEEYIRAFSVSEKGLRAGTYMRTLTKRETLGHLLSASAFVFAQRGQFDRAMKYLAKAIELDPKDALSYDNMRAAYEAASKRASGSLKEKYAEQARVYARKAGELGFVDPALVQPKKGVRGS